MTESARRAAELAARASYGRLLSLVAGRSGDIGAAEDALSDAFASALSSWPGRGVPANPDAWLLTAARNRALNSYRHRTVQDRAADEIERRYQELAADLSAFPDDRLKLMFVCAHPAIDPVMRTPLMLQTVLGLDAARIGSAFLVAPATMGQRLSRAKAKIRDSGVRFTVPDPEDMAERLDDVLNAIYAAFGAGWDDVSAAAGNPSCLTSEAIYLARLVIELLPEEPEAKGLAALMLYCEARRSARRDDEGRYVPLADQDVRKWTRSMIIEAEGLLTAASRHGRFGRLQCEAAIQSVHVQRAVTGAANHTALRTLYDLLVQHYPEIGAIVARAAALVEAGDIDHARESLDALPVERVARYQPYWAVQARALHLSRAFEAAEHAYGRAIGLSEDDGVKAHLRGQVSAMRLLDSVPRRP